MGTLKKVVLSFVVIILSLTVIFLTSQSTTTTSKDIRSKASTTSTNAVSLILTPNEATHKVGDVFDAQIYLNTFGVATNGVGARLKYDPGILDVVAVIPGNVFTTYPAATFNSSDGSIYLSGVAFNASAGKPVQPFVGTGLFGTIRFKAKIVSSQTSVNFVFTPGGRTDDSNVIDVNTTFDVLEKVYDATFTITP